jgi:aryl-alcohol dehydrogenase-like predicted oxidoreductase
MQYTNFGRTGLNVSVAGLGCGGFSRVGLGTGKTEAEAVAIVRAAIDLGVNLIDTAAVYGTEGVVGRAIEGYDRSKLVIATKAAFGRGPNIAPPEAVVASLDNSLRTLRTDYVDIFQLHAVAPDNYARVRDAYVPVLLRERAKGKFRHLGITETPPFDHGHAMLQQALPEGIWASAMVAQHMLHQNARERVYPLSLQHGVGTLLMFVVRGIFAQPERLQAELQELDLPDLDFLVHPGGASTLVDAAYRFIRHEPGVDVVLFGTGDQAHLATNIESLLKPALPAADIDRLRRVFGHVVGVGLDVPGRPRA